MVHQTIGELSVEPLSMFKTLFRSSEVKRDVTNTSDLAAHRAELEFALVFIETGSDAQLEHTISAVAHSADGYGGTVLQILGGLIFVAFSGVIGCASPSQRTAFVEYVCSSYRLFTKVVHGRASALVGTFSCETRMTYTAIPDDFGSMLKRFSQLKHGEAVEVGERGQ